MANDYDVIVLGSGPGGYVAAIRCAQLGLKTAIVERENLGGICLNWGCIPTKAMLRSAEIFHYMQHAGDYGLVAQGIEADLAAIVKRSRGVAKQLNQGVTHLMKKNKIAVHMGEGRLTGPTSLTVTSDKGEEQLTAKHVILATGARARDLPFAPADGKRVWTYRHAMTPSELPERLLVIGSGRDRDRVRELLQRPRQRGDGDRAARPHCARGGRRRLDLPRKVPEEAGHHHPDRRRARGSRGHRQRGQGHHQEQGGRYLDRRVHPRDRRHRHRAQHRGHRRGGARRHGPRLHPDRPYGRTRTKGLWAIGDCTPGPWLAHKASHEGVTAAEAIAQELGNKDVHPHPLNRAAIPGCTYCHPQIASVGMTEARAREAGHEVKVGNFPSSATARRSRSARPKASSRPSSTRRRASSSART